MNILTVIKALLVIYLLLIIAVYFFQRAMIYHPTPHIDNDFKSVKINHNDQTTEALLTHSSQQQVVIYFGGNAENIIYSATDFETHFPEHSTYLMKYRGYSGAIGNPTEKNLFADALALYDHINLQPNLHITVIGKSLGSGVASFLATKRTVNKLILVTPFDSVRALAQDLLPFLPVKWLLKDSYDSKSRVAGIEADTLVIVANNDKVIPGHRSNSLIESIPKKGLKIVTLNAEHNDIDLVPTYFKTMRLFMDYQDTL